MRPRTMIRPIYRPAPTHRTCRRRRCPPMTYFPATKRARAAGKPYSFLHISKAEIDLPPDIDHYAPEVYAKSAENLNKLIMTASCPRRKPRYYAYRLIMGSHADRPDCRRLGRRLRHQPHPQARIHPRTRKTTASARSRRSTPRPAWSCWPTRQRRSRAPGRRATTGTPIADLTADDGIRTPSG